MRPIDTPKTTSGEGAPMGIRRGLGAFRKTLSICSRRCVVRYLEFEKIWVKRDRDLWEQTPKSDHYRAFMTPFMGSSINIALPSIAEEFRNDAVLLSWIPASYLLATAVCLVPFGRLAVIYGRKRIFGFGVVAFGLSSLLCASSFSAPMLICFRVLQGVGGAMIFSTGVAILTSVFPPQERGKVLGFNVAAV
jgi:hypothetical protein